MKVLILTLLLLAAVPAMAGPQRTVLVNADEQGQCAAAQKKISAFIEANRITKPFELFVVCEASFWPKVVNAAHLRKDTLAFSTLFNDGRISRLTIPAISADSVFLEAEIRHELRHIECRCDEGDQK